MKKWKFYWMMEKDQIKINPIIYEKKWNKNDNIEDSI